MSGNLSSSCLLPAAHGNLTPSRLRFSGKLTLSQVQKPPGGPSALGEGGAQGLQGGIAAGGLEAGLQAGRDTSNLPEDLLTPGGTEL